MNAIVLLHEVVDEDPEKGQSTSEISPFYLRHTDFCILPNDRAWTELHYRGDIVMYVKEAPYELYEKVKNAYENKNHFSWEFTESPSLRVIQDDEKCVLINLNHVTAIRAITDTVTRFTFRRGFVNVNFPLAWMNIPQHKIKNWRRKNEI